MNEIILLIVLFFPDGTVAEKMKIYGSDKPLTQEECTMIASVMETNLKIEFPEFGVTTSCVEKSKLDEPVHNDDAPSIDTPT